MSCCHPHITSLSCHVMSVSSQGPNECFGGKNAHYNLKDESMMKRKQAVLWKAKITAVRQQGCPIQRLMTGEALTVSKSIISIDSPWPCNQKTNNSGFWLQGWVMNEKLLPLHCASPSLSHANSSFLFWNLKEFWKQLDMDTSSKEILFGANQLITNQNGCKAQSCTWILNSFRFSEFFS